MLNAISCLVELSLRQVMVLCFNWHDIELALPLKDFLYRAVLHSKTYALQQCLDGTMKHIAQKSDV